MKHIGLRALATSRQRETAFGGCILENPAYGGADSCCQAGIDFFRLYHLLYLQLFFQCFVSTNCNGD